MDHKEVSTLVAVRSSVTVLLSVIEVKVSKADGGVWGVGKLIFLNSRASEEILLLS